MTSPVHVIYIHSCLIPPLCFKTMADIHSGYDSSFLEKPPEVVQSDCPVCLLVLREPYQATCCGYSFCRLCFERIKIKKISCPCCKAEQFDNYPNKGLQRSLYNFKVYCTNKSQGCQWTGELGQLHQHLNLNPTDENQLEGCQYAQIQCLFCSKLYERSNVKIHQNDQCPKRPFSCEFCKDFHSHHENVTNNHWPVCTHYPVLCPNKCGKSLKRHCIGSHVAGECPLTIVICDFKHVGCDVTLPHEDLPVHLAENVVTHMSLQTASYKQLVQFVVRLQKDNQQLQQKIAKVTQDLQMLQSLVPILPVEISLLGFDRRKKNNEVWYSHPVYTKVGGYKMCLKIYTNGYGKHKGSHMSVFVNMMRGEFDDQLEWPFRGEIIVQLLNPNSDQRHCVRSFVYSDETIGSSDIANRVMKGDICFCGYGSPKFISHTELQQEYLKEDSFVLRVQHL